MKVKIAVAFILLLIGVAEIANWFIFCAEERKLKSADYREFTRRYINRFPEFVQPLYNTHPPAATVVLIIMLTVAGLLFIKTYNKIYITLGIISFLLAFWDLFSLM